MAEGVAALQRYSAQQKGAQGSGGEYKCLTFLMMIFSGNLVWSMK